ncbi:MAG: hypothetical protein OXN89_10185 [Bryobacterales bacterium]|nr:hypothetical protein [Bryobacterales bacterium]
MDKCVAPYVIVLLDHDLRWRGTYKLLEAVKLPDFALDVISPYSELRNRKAARKLYARM